MGTEKDIELTEAQARALRWFGGEAEVLPSGYARPRPSRLTARILVHAGLLTPTYSVTDAGRAALAAYEGAK